MEPSSITSSSSSGKDPVKFVKFNLQASKKKKLKGSCTQLQKNKDDLWKTIKNPKPTSIGSSSSPSFHPFSMQCPHCKAFFTTKEEKTGKKSQPCAARRLILPDPIKMTPAWEPTGKKCSCDGCLALAVKGCAADPAEYMNCVETISADEYWKWIPPQKKP